MRILALVTARAGSKRIPGKNVRMLAGRPLVRWTLDAVRDVQDVCDTLVSTDDEAVASIARDAGALVPWLRPAHLSTDSAPSSDVALHALDWYEGARGAVDGLVLLQPTSPFRSRESIRAGIEMFARHGRSPVIGVSPAASHPMHCFWLEDGRLRLCVEPPEPSRTRDLPRAYAVNGAFYLVTPQHLRTARSFYGGNPVPLVMDDPREAIDIDTEWDWMVAEAAVQQWSGRR